jgi:hypothetical protein
VLVADLNLQVRLPSEMRECLSSECRKFYNPVANDVYPMLQVS